MTPLRRSGVPRCAHGGPLVQLGGVRREVRLRPTARAVLGSRIRSLGSQADRQTGRRVVDSKVVATGAERPILSSRFSMVQRPKRPNFRNILDRSKDGFAVPSGT